MTFLQKLKKILAIERNDDFARLCRKQQTNITNYLNDNPAPKRRALEDCLLNATVSRVFDEPPDENTKLGRKAKRLRERVEKSIKESTVSNLFGQEIRPNGEVIEILEEPRQQRQQLPQNGGVYVLYDSAGNVLYIGKGKNLRTEVQQSLRRKVPVGMRFGPDMQKSQPFICDLATYMSLYEIDNARLRHNIEALLIRVFINQTHNSNIGKFKTDDEG